MSSSIDAGFTTARLTGEVVRVGDSGYEAARVGWNRCIRAIPRPSCSAATHKTSSMRSSGPVRSAARSGPHSPGGLVLDRRGLGHRRESDEEHPDRRDGAHRDGGTGPRRPNGTGTGTTRLSCRPDQKGASVV